MALSVSQLNPTVNFVLNYGPRLAMPTSTLAIVVTATKRATRYPPLAPPHLLTSLVMAATARLPYRLWYPHP